MRFDCAQKEKRSTSGVIAFIVLGILLLNAAAYFVYTSNFGVHALSNEINRYEVQNKLLLDAMQEVGVCSPKRAAEVWASGLQKRSAALQYAVMTAAFQKEYVKQLEKSAPNWVTGLSSPWIDSFTIMRSDRPNEKRYVFEILFSTQTSTGPAGDYTAAVTVDREGDFWRISNIAADEQLYPYTRYKP